jgi:toxin ParE1/3/4
MIRIFKSPQYQTDVGEIWNHISQSSPKGAEKVIEGVEDVIGLLADFPSIGTLCPHLAPNLRRCRWREFLIYYRYSGGDVEIVRVLHGRRSIDPDMFE